MEHPVCIFIISTNFEGMLQDYLIDYISCLQSLKKLLILIFQGQSNLADFEDFHVYGKLRVITAYIAPHIHDLTLTARIIDNQLMYW